MVNIYITNPVSNSLDKIAKPIKGCWINMIRPTDEEIKKVCEEANVDEQLLRYPLDIAEKAHEDKETQITEELLIDNGFEYLERESNLTQDYHNQLFGKDNYKVFRKWTNDSSPLKLDIDNGVNNRGTEWYLHIDNDHCCSIGSADIDNVWEFNTLMEVFGSKFRL